VRICVIFNPAARGDKARQFRRHLAEMAAHSTLKQTEAPNEAQRLATEAVGDGFDIIVAAGGDGTINEVLNGIADAPGGLERVRLGVLPLGTVNVFARELAIPLKFDPAWRIIQQGRERWIDLPVATGLWEGKPRRRCFAQLGGAGLDARAIECVHWPLKKKVGPLAYVMAGLRALRIPPTRITVSAGDNSASGDLVLLGNGALYGGPFRIFPGASLTDGLLDVCVFPRASWWTLAQCGPSLLVRGELPPGAVHRFQADTVTLTGMSQTPFELDGEWMGHLPVTVTVQRSALRVIAPA
jgi:diacylglycerol kinase (ATP)